MIDFMRRRHARHKRKTFLRRLTGAVFTLVLAMTFTAVAIFLLWISSFNIPDPTSLQNRRVTESTKIYDRTGKILLYDVHENIKRKVLPLSLISRHVKNAAVAIEDAEFYQHRGIRPLSFLRAIMANIGSGSFSQGGSTITQQVVKNSLLTSEKRISRKIKEWVLAVKLEQAYSKEQILGIYLNEAPYGGSIYGIEEAGQSFFGKPAMELSVAEAAYLAALPNAPSFYSPYGAHRDKLEERKNMVLKQMLANRFIAEDEYQRAMAEKVEFRAQEEKGIKAPHFVFYVKQYLEEKYGRQFVEEQGLKVTTTLDYELQKKAEEVVKKFAIENKKVFDAENAALVGLTPGTGEITVMVGSRDYFDTEIQGNFNVATAKRQPGSAFKPFVYAAAFEKGFLPQTVVLDIKTEFSTECNPNGSPKFGSARCYNPENYDKIYRGPVTLRQALAQSINIPSIKTLYLAGLKNSLDTAKDMGITTLTDIDRYGLTLVLGGGEVTLLELTSAYGVFANEGIRVPHTAILKIENKDGEVVEENRPTANRVISEDAVKKINDVLSDTAARAPAFGTGAPLGFPGRSVAVKTGTTNDYRDAWIIGYTPDFVLGAWAGNNDNRPMEKKVARFIVAPLWNAFMNEVLPSLPDKKFPKVADIEDRSVNPVLRGFWEGGQTYVMDRISGKLATPFTPEETKKEKSIRNIHTILYWVSKENPQGGRPVQPESDSQFASWEYAVSAWALAQGLGTGGETAPTAHDDIHVPANNPRVVILSPRHGDTLVDTAKVEIAATGSGPYPMSRMDVFINGFYAGSARGQPFTLSFSLADLPLLKIENEVRVVMFDTAYNKGEAATFFRTRL